MLKTIDFLLIYYLTFQLIIIDHQLNGQRPSGDNPFLQINNLRRKIDLILELLNLNKTLGQLMPINSVDFTRPLEDVADCYDYKLKYQNNDDNQTTFINIFDSNRKFNDIVKFYYEIFSNNQLTSESIRSLLESTREIIVYCLLMENRIKSNDTLEYHLDTLKFGFTELSDKDQHYMRRLNGINPDETLLPWYWYQGNHVQQLQYRNDFSTNSTSNMISRSDGSNPRCKCQNNWNSMPENFDWRQQNKVKCFGKNQMKCSSDWAIAAVESIESNYLIHNPTTRIRRKRRMEPKSNDEIDLSEQELISCALRHGCQMGSSVIAFDFVRRYGLALERDVPYQGRVTACPRIPIPWIRIKDYCIRSRLKYTQNSAQEYLTDDDIRHALITYGPLYILLNSDRLSKNYRHGIIDDPSCSHQANHAALLVGYTRDAWILKNTWAIGWGEPGGYFRLARGKNMCGINTEIAYPLF